MADRPFPLWKKLLFIPAVLIGAGVLYYAVQHRDPPKHKPPQENKVAARVIAAPAVPVVPRALAYGTAQPDAVWQAVAEVGGKVVEIHPDLKKGAILPRGTVLLAIDQTDYRLAVARLEATVRDTQAKLAELDVREQNTRAALQIEDRSLALSRKDLERKQTLARQKNVSQAAVDQEERNVLARQQSVQTQRNALNLIPAERESLNAQLAVNEAQLQAARLDLERTRITAPFDGRVAQVNVERAQYASAGQVLAVLDSIAAAEVTAQLPIQQLMTLVATRDVGQIQPETVMQRIRDILGLEPVVRLQAGDVRVEWPARLARINDTIDPETRTVGVIVAVDDPYRRAQPGQRPPLAKNMYVEVELRGKPKGESVVVPRAAVRDGAVFVLDGDNRLHRRPVQVAFRQTDFVVLGGGVTAGERVVVSDLVPAIDGMLIEPVNDEEARAALVAAATGQGQVR
ncbi:MAG: efflux RND transporter periplasmic adaptor subunit [Hyphomicrobiales bacterium]|nr:efflux RND transporter periplasmic adaptor subunit [Hyphomicrobiales bacterium]